MTTLAIILCAIVLIMWVDVAIYGMAITMKYQTHLPHIPHIIDRCHDCEFYRCVPNIGGVCKKKDKEVHMCEPACPLFKRGNKTITIKHPPCG